MDDELAGLDWYPPPRGTADEDPLRLLGAPVRFALEFCRLLAADPLLVVTFPIGDGDGDAV